MLQSDQYSGFNKTFHTEEQKIDSKVTSVYTSTIMTSLNHLGARWYNTNTCRKYVASWQPHATSRTSSTEEKISITPRQQPPKNNWRECHTTGLETTRGMFWEEQRFSNVLGQNQCWLNTEAKGGCYQRRGNHFQQIVSLRVISTLCLSIVSLQTLMTTFHFSLPPSTRPLSLKGQKREP